MHQERLCHWVWTPEPEFFVGCSIFSCCLVLCRLQTLLLQSPSLSFPWIHWLSLDQKSSVRVWSPCEEVFWCRAGTKFVGWWSGHDCCAGTLPWVRGRTSRLATRSRKAGGTGPTLGWHALSVCWCKEAKLQARIKPTALRSAIDKENSIEFSLDFLHYLYNYYMVCALFSHAYYVTHHVTLCDVMLWLPVMWLCDTCDMILSRTSFCVVSPR